MNDTTTTSGTDLPSITTTVEAESREAQEIAHLISEAIHHDGFEPPRVIAKPTEVVGALIHLLVAKGLLTETDVKRILASPRTSV